MRLATYTLGIQESTKRVFLNVFTLDKQGGASFISTVYQPMSATYTVKRGLVHYQI